MKAAPRLKEATFIISCMEKASIVCVPFWRIKGPADSKKKKNDYYPSLSLSEENITSKNEVYSLRGIFFNGPNSCNNKL